VTRVEPRSNTTQTVGLFGGPVGGTDGIDNTDITDEHTDEAGEPHNRAAEDGRAKPICVESPKQDQDNREREKDRSATTKMPSGMARSVITTLKQRLLDNKTEDQQRRDRPPASE
jgi:hypothetical protein